MKDHKLPTRRPHFTAIAAALALVTLGGSFLAAPTVAQAASKTVQTVKVDVDGDGHKDTVRVSRLSTHKFKISVKTRKKTATKTITTSGDSQGLTKPLFGAATLDGVKGNELIVTTSNICIATGVVLTWRKGKLVAEKGPRTVTMDNPWTTWRWCDEGDEYRVGYRFFTSKGKRYVDVTFVAAAEAAESAGWWWGYTTRSKWTNGAWKYQRTTDIPDQFGAMPPGGFLGVKLTT